MKPEDNRTKEIAGLSEIFWVFTKIGAFTIGGGYAMIPLIQNEMSRRGWLSEEELPDIIALAQSAPGILAVNVAIFAGYRIRGLKGSIVATVGTALPSFLIILFIAALFSGYQNNPDVIRIFNKTWWAWTISGITLALVSFLKVSPIYILLTIIVSALSITYYRNKKGKN